MTHRLSRALVIGLISLAAAVGTAQANHTWNGGHWASSPVTYHNIADVYGGNVASRVTDFNGAVSNVQMSSGGSGSNVQIADANYGAVAWAGLCTYDATGTWTFTAYVDLNEYYMSGYSGNKRSAVVAHEFGHCVAGMEHHNASGRIMQSSIGAFYDTDGVWGIDSSTAADIDAFWN